MNTNIDGAKKRNRDKLIKINNTEGRRSVCQDSRGSRVVWRLFVVHYSWIGRFPAEIRQSGSRFV